jgi:hypothetical protein
MYWTDSAIDNIRRADLDGSNIEVLVSGLTNVFSIALDAGGGKMYWAEPGVDAIRRANLDGTSVENIVTGLPNPLGIAVDASAGQIYWTDTDITARRIQRANLDGTGLETLVTGLSVPNMIALAPLAVPEPSGPILAGCAAAGLLWFVRRQRGNGRFSALPRKAQSAATHEYMGAPAG